MVSALEISYMHYLLYSQIYLKLTDQNDCLSIFVQFHPAFFINILSMMQRYGSRSSQKREQHLQDQPRAHSTDSKHRDCKIMNKNIFQSYQNSINACFGQLFQFQFGQIVTRICENQQFNVQFLNIDVSQLKNQILFNMQKYLEECEYGISKNQRVTTTSKTFLSQIFQIIAPLDNLSGDIEVFMQNLNGKNYKEFHGQIWGELQEISQKDKKLDLWLEEDYLNLNNDFKISEGETVKYVFQMKRNMFTQITENEKKDLSTRKEANTITETQKKRQKNQMFRNEESPEATSQSMPNFESNQEQQIITQKKKLPRNQKSKNKGEFKAKTRQIRSQKVLSQPRKNKLAQIQKVFNKHEQTKASEIIKLRNSKVLQNLQQLLEISLAAKYMSKTPTNNCVFDESKIKNAKISLYLVLNKGLSKQQFYSNFDYLKPILKSWFIAFGVILHVIGFNPKSQREIEVNNKLEKITAENARIIAENARIIAENARIIAENARIIAENDRIIAENDRMRAENGQIILKLMDLSQKLKSLMEKYK